MEQEQFQPWHFISRISSYIICYYSVLEVWPSHIKGIDTIEFDMKQYGLISDDISNVGFKSDIDIRKPKVYGSNVGNTNNLLYVGNNIAVASKYMQVLNVN